MLEERLEKEVLANLISYLLLKAVDSNNGESWGYQMKKYVEGQLGKYFKAIPEGTLYPILSKFSDPEKFGYLESVKGKASKSDNRERRFYRLTKKGREQLRTWPDKWHELNDFIVSILNCTEQSGVMWMVEVFDKYLSQIRKKPKMQSVKKEFIDEFLENLSDQLYSMLDELMTQEPELDESDAIVSVLSSCESVDVVVTQVVTQYHSNEGVPDIGSTDALERLSFLTPIESKLVVFSRRINSRIDLINRNYQNWSAWY
jgi:PadR family transcriptional regulator, regulatory protein PadR